MSHQTDNHWRLSLERVAVPKRPQLHQENIAPVTKGLATLSRNLVVSFTIKPPHRLICRLGLGLVAFSFLSHKHRAYFTQGERYSQPP